MLSRKYTKVIPRPLSIASACAQAHATAMRDWLAPITAPSVRKLAVLTTRPAASKISLVLATKLNTNLMNPSYHRKLTNDCHLDCCMLFLLCVFSILMSGLEVPEHGSRENCSLP